MTKAESGQWCWDDLDIIRYRFWAWKKGMKTETAFLCSITEVSNSQIARRLLALCPATLTDPKVRAWKALCVPADATTVESWYFSPGLQYSFFPIVLPFAASVSINCVHSLSCSAWFLLLCPSSARYVSETPNYLTFNSYSCVCRKWAFVFQSILTYRCSLFSQTFKKKKNLL